MTEDHQHDLPPLDAYADDLQEGSTPAPVSLEDFYAYLPDHRYIFAATRELWPAASVNSRVPSVKIGTDLKGDDVHINAAQWLDQNRSVEQMSWIPGEPMIIRDRLVADGGWIERAGCNTFNLYRPPALTPGNASEAGHWIDHVRHVYPAESEHLIRWLAHRVQRPGEKINHAIVLGGAQGIGKDTILEPVKYAVGAWNFAEVSPQHLFGSFNGFIKSVILRLSEARDLGDVDRYAFYEHCKQFMAAPPDVLRCNEKNLREHAVRNVMGVIITTNHKTDGIYLPADDRRHFVAWSPRTKEEFSGDYFVSLYRWYSQGGTENVASYLAALDLTGFDPKAPPPKTAAFFDIVDANRAPEDAELADVIESLSNPAAVTIEQLANYAADDFREWLKGRNNRRTVPHRMESAGYVPCRNPNANDGLWRILGKRQAVYTQRALSVRDQLAAAARLAQPR